MKPRSAIIGAFISGLCLYLALSHTASPLIWIALVPLFLVTHDHHHLTHDRRALTNRLHFIDRRRFLPGFVAGAAMAYGIPLFVLCVSVFAFGCGLLLACCPPPLIVPVWVLAIIIINKKPSLL